MKILLSHNNKIITMKKLYALLTLALLAGNSFAQNGTISPYAGQTGNIPKMLGEKHHAPAIQKRNVTSFYLDYEALESDFSGTQYQTFYDIMNLNFTSIDSFTNDWIAVGYDTIVDYSTLQGYDYSSISTITIDSIFWRMGHVNHSGTNDTLHLRVVALDANGDPTETNIWDTMFISNTSFTGLAINQLPTFFVTPNITVTPPNAFGVRLDYSGDKTDTCSYIFGFTDGGAFGQCNYSAYQSLTWPNSYFFMNYGGGTLENMWPRNGGQNFLYRDCNGNGSYDGPTDPEENLNQNFSIWSYVTVENPVGIDNPLSNLKFDLYPNPANDILYLDFNAAQINDYSISISNLQGQIIYQASFGKTISKNQIDVSGFANGIYLININDGANVVTDRFVINR